MWTPASIGFLVAASSSTYLVHDAVRFSSTGASVGDAHASRRRHSQPLPGRWSADSSVLPLPAAAQNRTAGSVLYAWYTGHLVTIALCARLGRILFRSRVRYSTFVQHLFRSQQFRRPELANRQATRSFQTLVVPFIPA